MGGFGSGRTDGQPIAETALRIDLAWMMRTGRAREGSLCHGSLYWTCGGEPSGNIRYACEMGDPENAELRLNFMVGDRWSGEKRHYEQRVRLCYTVPNFGGKRWWMRCPANGSRVGKLYCPAGADTFASRTAWGIAYRSQRETDSDRAFSRLNKLQSQLGCREGCEEPIYRPKGMWHRTFARHEERYWELRDQCDYEWLKMAGKLIGLEDRFGL